MQSKYHYNICNYIGIVNHKLEYQIYSNISVLIIQFSFMLFGFISIITFIFWLISINSILAIFIKVYFTHTILYTILLIFSFLVTIWLFLIIFILLQIKFNIILINSICRRLTHNKWPFFCRFTFWTISITKIRCIWILIFQHIFMIFL